jgi:hypothetical protein
VDREDGQLAVLGRVDDVEPAIGDQRALDDPAALDDLVGRDRDPEVHLVLHVVGPVMVGVDGLHRAGS